MKPELEEIKKLLKSLDLTINEENIKWGYKMMLRQLELSLKISEFEELFNNESCCGCCEEGCNCGDCDCCHGGSCDCCEEGCDCGDCDCCHGGSCDCCEEGCDCGDCDCCKNDECDCKDGTCKTKKTKKK